MPEHIGRLQEREALDYGELVTRGRMADDQDRRNEVLTRFRAAAADPATTRPLKTPLQVLIITSSLNTRARCRPTGTGCSGPTRHCASGGPAHLVAPALGAAEAPGPVEDLRDRRLDHQVAGLHVHHRVRAVGADKKEVGHVVAQDRPSRPDTQNGWLEIQETSGSKSASTADPFPTNSRSRPVTR
jgi:hypothetical protein